MLGTGIDQLWRSGCGAIAGCHCRVPFGAIVVTYVFFGGGVTTTFEGVDVVPLHGAIVVYYG